MGYGPEDKNVVVELTYNYGVKEYDKGNGYAQVFEILLEQYIISLILTRNIDRVKRLKRRAEISILP